MGRIPIGVLNLMLDNLTTAVSRDLAHIVRRVENGAVLGAEFCDRLTRSLAQLFVIAADVCSDDDRAAFDRILIRVAPIAEVGARLFLSERLADAAAPPRAILIRLAHDEPTVARPILVRSPALDEDDLVDIARSHGPGHMGAIAERRDLGLRITDILVLRGDDEIRRLVAANPTARISDKSFSRLSLQARLDTVIEARLIARGDLPDVVIRFLVDNGSEAAAAALVERERSARARHGLDRGTLSIRVAEDGWLETYDFDAARAILERVPEVKNHVDGFIRRLAEADRFAEVVHILTAVSGLTLETMKHVLVSLDTHPFAVVARALTLKSDTVRELLSTGPWIHRLDDRGRTAALAEFRAIDPDEARTRLARWVAEDQAGAKRGRAA